MKVKKGAALLLAAGMLVMNSFSSLAGEAEPQTFETEQTTSETVSGISPRMGLFDHAVYTEGGKVISMIHTTKGVKAHVDWLPDGCYVQKARAGLKQGNKTKYSEYVTDGTASVSMTNNPLQKDYARNKWVYYFE